METKLINHKCFHMRLTVRGGTPNLATKVATRVLQQRTTRLLQRTNALTLLAGPNCAVISVARPEGETDFPG